MQPNGIAKFSSEIQGTLQGLAQLQNHRPPSQGRLLPLSREQVRIEVFRKKMKDLWQNVEFLLQNTLVRCVMQVKRVRHERRKEIGSYVFMFSAQLGKEDQYLSHITVHPCPLEKNEHNMQREQECPLMEAPLHGNVKSRKAEFHLTQGSAGALYQSKCLEYSLGYNHRLKGKPPRTTHYQGWKNIFRLTVNFSLVPFHSN